ncbi:ester cyclase [Streptomyces sp. B3I8]|uniref:ester cyclase n=1 Tax=Streptomyces sp. B3I8 TaxID=3042303 RepID=UPI002780C232|nr:ester cyclase [Streptomyces sp. B3I8]MDQ0788537.1 putative ester cyclase [Streptomyces sp. B3I8]
MGKGDRNTRRMRLFVEEVQNNARLELIDELVSPSFHNHSAEPGRGEDREGVRAAVAALHAAFSDLRVEVKQCVGEGDLVATHKVLRGRHTGEWAGIAPSGRPFALEVMDLVRYRDGLQVEHWSVADALGFLRQTGALPGGRDRDTSEG